MKRVKITLPKGGTKAVSNNPQGLNGGAYAVSPHTVTYEAEEIIIEGDVTLTQVTSARIPFDLEAAKAGAQVLWGDDPVRWVGRGNEKSSIQAFNIIEHSEGLAYAPDKVLFMAPKNKKKFWANLYRDGSYCMFGSIEDAEDAAKQWPKSTHEAIAVEIEV
jgi:hypothetical protein